MEDEEGNFMPGSPETIPMEYNQQTTLEFMVEADIRNEANFDLISGGDIASNDDYGGEGYGAEDYMEAEAEQP